MVRSLGIKKTGVQSISIAFYRCCFSEIIQHCSQLTELNPIYYLTSSEGDQRTESMQKGYKHVTKQFFLSIRRLCILQLNQQNSFHCLFWEGLNSWGTCFSPSVNTQFLQLKHKSFFLLLNLLDFRYGEYNMKQLSDVAWEGKLCLASQVLRIPS